MSTLVPILRDDRSAEFFDAAAQGTLLYQKCANCGYAQLPIAGGTVGTRCRNCGQTKAAWTPASGAATLVSWTSSPVRTADGTVPGPVIGLLELAEGPWMEAQLHALSGDAAQLAEGAPFTVAFETPAGSEAIPVFVPAS
jgi:uncharacterized OB-fold protein